MIRILKVISVFVLCPEMLLPMSSHFHPRCNSSSSWWRLSLSITLGVFSCAMCTRVEVRGGCPLSFSTLLLCKGLSEPEGYHSEHLGSSESPPCGIVVIGTHGHIWLLCKCRGFELRPLCSQSKCCFPLKHLPTPQAVYFLHDLQVE